MLDKGILQQRIGQCLHWMFTNYEDTITIDVKNVVDGEEYYINTLWQIISYTAQVGDTALDILTQLQILFEGENVTSSIVNDKLVISKSLNDYFYYFDLSENLKFEPFLTGRILIQDQNSPQPNKTYLTLKIITGLNDLGGNNIKWNGSNYELSNLKRFTLNIQAFGSESFNYLSYLKSIIMLDETVKYCQNKGISFISPQDLIDVSSLINNGFEQRHSLDIICYTKDNTNLSIVPAESAIINLNLS